MLLRADEYPIHQIAQTFAAVLGSDPQWNDGHYVCLCDLEGNVCLVSTVRLYQNNDVLDGFVCIRHRGRQHNIRVSRRLRPNMDEYRVGPLRVEIVEPMQALRLVLEPNEHGIACDVLCRTTAVPYEDPVQVTRVDGRLLSERAVYEVAGVCEGWVSVGGARYELSPATSSFFRNHSWGCQGGRGGPRLYGAPPLNPRGRSGGLRNWVLFRMPDHAGFYEFFEDAGGIRVSSEGAILYDDRSVPVSGIEHQLEFYDGSIRLSGGTVILTEEGGARRSYRVQDLGWVYCQGGGYFGGFNDGLGQGVYRGDMHVEGEVWDVSHPTRVVRPDGRVIEFEGAWAESFTRLESDGQTGLAHFECVVFGQQQAVAD